MTLVTNKTTGDTIEAFEWNEAATAANKVTDQTLVAADISDFDIEVSNNASVAANTAAVATKISNDLGNSDLQNIRVSEYNGVVDNGNSGASKNIDWTAGNIQKVNLDQNTTLTFTAPSGPTTVLLQVTGGGSFTITWPTVTWLTSGGTAPTLDGTDFVSFLYDGTNWVGTISNQS